MWVGFAVGCALFVVGAAIGWFVWLPEYRPGLQSGETFGIDVSHHQGEIDWSRVASDDIDFAYIKATQGSDFLDPRFLENWSAAAEAGLERGAYHFFTLCRPGREQAEHFLAAAPDGDLPLAVDLELAGNCSERPPADDVMAELGDFLAAVEADRGEQVVLYVGDDWEAVYPVRDEFKGPLWHRRILRRPDRNDWWIWQFSGMSHVDGVGGDVDLNVMRSTAP